MIATAAAGVACLVWPRSRTAADPVSRDENLPDISQYDTVRFPEREPDLDAVAWYARADAMTADVRSKFPHHLNLSYGTHVKQRLDLYLPKEKPVRPAPVMSFFHGGGFEEGHRAHYGFIALPFALQGIITAIVGYRLVPDGFHYPAQLDDVRSSAQWLHTSVARYGGNPDLLFVSGHSAGAMLAAEAGSDRSWMPAYGIPISALRGIAPVSGNYDLIANPMNGQVSYYAPNAVAQDQASALRHIRNPVPAAVVSHGQGDAYERALTKLSPEFVAALQAQGVDAELLLLTGAGHLDMVAELSKPGSRVSSRVIAMIKKHSA